jgi:predicted nucleotidyltransferase component of viral defense system
LQYPEHLRIHKESILKEYLQYKILNIIYNIKFTTKLVFLGGTALRIIYGNTRFSEDLDFDNLGLNQAQWSELSSIIKTNLELEGIEAEIKTITQKAFRIKVKIPRLLFNTGISPLPEQKILIQLDTTPQYFDYTPEKPFLNKFEIFTRIFTVPKSLLLSQKIYAAINRKRIMGRDFFDIVFLNGIGAQPNYLYLKQHLQIKNQEELKDFLLEKTKDFDFNQLAQDVKPFLINPNDIQKVRFFRDYLKSQL